MGLHWAGRDGRVHDPFSDVLVGPLFNRIVLDNEELDDTPVSYAKIERKNQRVRQPTLIILTVHMSCEDDVFMVIKDLQDTHR